MASSTKEKPGLFTIFLKRSPEHQPPSQLGGFPPRVMSGVFLDNVLRLGLRVDGILQADTRHRYTDKRGSDLPRFGALDETFAASEDLHNLPNDASEGRGSSEPVDSLMMLLLSLHLRGPDLKLSAATSEASAPKVAPVAQASTASSLSKGKDAPAAAAAPPSDLRGVISSLEAFASQFTSLEADKIRLQEEAKSSSSKLEGAIKKAAVARQEVDSLKEELNKLKERLKEEEARAAEKDELLRQSALALLEAANIPATALDKIPSNSPANGVSTVLTAHQLTRGLLDKGKGALARMHLMIFPKATQEKTPGQLIDAFAVDTKEVIEVFKRTSRTYGALLAFQLMMGYGFKADIEEMTKELPKRWAIY
ncbi:hypothetical protein QYE76_065212 [Lolium multiflorum]|uniref:FRIGIDA-like protein n=1 Tax=Lolium multiflorum TaxID=4521 RepID=A0AAD8S8G6_LOLMU|nr:hypothetical protein QYE76_065212 [Lolium multiflorum]